MYLLLNYTASPRCPLLHQHEGCHADCTLNKILLLANWKAETQTANYVILVVVGLMAIHNTTHISTYAAARIQWVADKALCLMVNRCADTGTGTDVDFWASSMCDFIHLANLQSALSDIKLIFSSAMYTAPTAGH